MASSYNFSYRQQLYGLVLLLALLLLTAFLSVQHSREKRHQSQLLSLKLQLTNEQIASQWHEGENPDSIYARCQSKLEGLRLTLIDTCGRVLYDSDIADFEVVQSSSPADGKGPTVPPIENHLDRSEVQQALATGRGETLRRHSTSTHRDYFYSALYTKGIIIRTAQPYKWSLGQSLLVENRYIWLTLVITLLVIFVGYLVTRRLNQNIAHLRRFSDRLDRGEEISNLGGFPDDELGKLSEHIVELYMRLQRALEKADSEHRIAIEQEQEKILIKRQLTNNISHELKTPVSAIRGYLESLLLKPDMEPATRERFLRQGLEQTERLQALLHDIALITRMEEAPRMIAREECDLRAIINEVATELQPKLEGELSLRCELPDELPMHGNHSLLGSIFRNLIENALAYSGGDTLEIRLVGQHGEAYCLSVADNGSGVEPSHLGRLFERFYRVDKGRSRKSGGTGLGLSIVKNAVLFHGGTIEARNRETGGLELLFTLQRRAS